MRPQACGPLCNDGSGTPEPHEALQRLHACCAVIKSYGRNGMHPIGFNAPGHALCCPPVAQHMQHKAQQGIQWC